MSDLALEEIHEFAREVLVLSRRMRQGMETGLRPLGLNEPRGNVIFWLSRYPGGVSQTALAELAMVEAATLVRTLDQLEKQGLTKREPSRSDRRVKHVHLTEAGRAFVPHIDAITFELSRRQMMCLTDEERTQLVGLLRRVQQSFADSEGESDVPLAS
jgi:MarR family transcriptional regulator for hemolysin